MLHCTERYSFLLLKMDHLEATAHSQKRNSSDNGLHIFRVLLKMPSYFFFLMYIIDNYTQHLLNQEYSHSVFAIYCKIKLYVDLTRCYNETRLTMIFIKYKSKTNYINIHRLHFQLQTISVKSNFMFRFILKTRNQTSSYCLVHDERYLISIERNFVR